MMETILQFPKNKLLLVAFVYLISFLCAPVKSFSQHIPDTNFANAIRSVCPTCIDASNNLLSPAASLTTLNVSGKNIGDLTGIGGFTLLEHLNCENNQFVNLPTLPTNLTNFNCSYNQLTSLPNLPNSIVVLHCSNNQLTNLPVLPNNLSELYCQYNPLISLPNYTKRVSKVKLS